MSGFILAGLSKKSAIGHPNVGLIKAMAKPEGFY
jgi:hypothetical protein